MKYSIISKPVKRLLALIMMFFVLFSVVGCSKGDSGSEGQAVKTDDYVPVSGDIELLGKRLINQNYIDNGIPMYVEEFLDEFFIEYELKYEKIEDIDIPDASDDCYMFIYSGDIEVPMHENMTRGDICYLVDFKNQTAKMVKGANYGDFWFEDTKYVTEEYKNARNAMNTQMTFYYLAIRSSLDDAIEQYKEVGGYQ